MSDYRVKMALAVLEDGLRDGRSYTDQHQAMARAHHVLSEDIHETGDCAMASCEWQWRAEASQREATALREANVVAKAQLTAFVDFPYCYERCHEWPRVAARLTLEEMRKVETTKAAPAEQARFWFASKGGK